MGERSQTRIVVDGEITSVGFDTPIVRRPDGLWDVVGQERLFEPAPEQLAGQAAFDWPEGFE